MGRIATSLKPRRIEDAMNAPKRYWNGLDDASRKAVKKASFAGLILGIVLVGITCIPSAIADVATDLILMAFGHAQNASLLSNFLWPIVGLILIPVAAKRSIPLPTELDTPEA